MENFELAEYKVLYNVSLLLAGQPSEETFAKTAYTIASETDLHGCSIWKKKQGFAGIMRLGYYQSGSDSFLPHLDYQVAEQVIHSGQPWSKNWFEGTAPSGGEGSFNSLALPLEYEGELMGALCLWMSKHQKSEMSRHLARELAAQISRSVANVVLATEEREGLKPGPEAPLPAFNRTSIVPRVPGVGLAARSVSVRKEGTDFYDFLAPGESELAFILGDTMSLGVASTVLQFTTRMVFRAVAGKRVGPGKILARTNEVLYPELKNQGMIIGAICGLYNPQTELLRFANAGYNDPIIFSSRGCTFAKAKQAGSFLGLTENPAYVNHSVKLLPGDIVVFYSDGLTEGINESGESYTRERIKTTIDKYRLYDATSLLDCLFLDVGSFLGGRRQLDDITLITLKAG